MTVACSQTRVSAHSGQLQMTSELWLFLEHTTDLVIEAFLQLVPDCGMTFHPDYTTASSVLSGVSTAPQAELCVTRPNPTHQPTEATQSKANSKIWTQPIINNNKPT